MLLKISNLIHIIYNFILFQIIRENNYDDGKN